MFCSRYKKLIVPYSEGGLDERVRAKVEQHLATCAHCRNELNAIQSISCALRSMENPAVQPVGDLWARVSAQIDVEPRRQRKVWMPQAVAAALAVVTIIGFAVTRPNPTPQRSTIAVIRHKPVQQHIAEAPSKTQLPQSPSASVKHHTDKPVRMAMATPEHDNVLPVSGTSSRNTPSISRDESVLLNKMALEEVPDLNKNAGGAKSAEEPTVIAAAPAPQEASQPMLKASVRAMEMRGASPAFDTANANLSNNQSTVLDTDKTLAQNLADTGKLDQAIKERENVLNSNPKDTPTAQFLLAAYAVMNNNSGAISVAGQLINIDPANTQAYSMELAAAHERAGERDAAIAAYTQATQGPDPAIASQAKEKIEALNSKK